MTSLLDQVVANTPARGNGSGPVIISEQHDVSKINWVNGLSDPGEMISCGYLPEIRRQQGEQDREYADRIRPIVMALPKDQRDRIMGSAVRRLGADTSKGRVAIFVAGEPAWHELGTNVREAVDSRNAIVMSGQDYHVAKQAMAYRGENGEWVEDTETFSVVRQDTFARLGTVGTKYEVFQNADSFAFLDSVIGEFDARYESAGALFGGKQIWILVKLPQQAFKVKGLDEIEAYGLFTNSHDGKSAARCLPTSNRVECANTMRVALRQGKGKGITIRHVGNLKAKVEEARQALGLAIRGFDQFKDDMEVLASTKVPDTIGYFDGVLDHVCDVTAAQARMGADALAATLAVTAADLEAQKKWAEKQIEKRKSLLDDILERYESERCGVNGIRGTAFSALNAVTEFVDHSSKIRYNGTAEARASRKFENVLWGDGDGIKQTAYEQAMEYAAS